MIRIETENPRHLPRVSMRVLDKIDELELDEDFVEVLTSKLKEK